MVFLHWAYFDTKNTINVGCKEKIYQFTIHIFFYKPLPTLKLENFNIYLQVCLPLLILRDSFTWPIEILSEVMFPSM